MNCAFIGHKNVTEQVKISLKKTILNLIKTKRIEKFLVGNNGNFDYYAQCVLQELNSIGFDIPFNIVLSRLGEKALSGNQDATIFPEALENTIPRFAISKRNDWLIKNASFLIVYVSNKFSNSIKWLEKATKKGLKIINLADTSFGTN